MAHILVVDDNDELRVVLRLFLEAAGHSIDEAENGRAAIAALKTAHFDLVITDILMPDTDGIEVLRAIRRDHAGLKVIATSGGGSMLDADMALWLSTNLGAAAVLRKPVPRAKLLEAVAAALTPPAE
jgi:CheY-like chemotaxis protein